MQVNTLNTIKDELFEKLYKVAIKQGVKHFDAKQTVIGKVNAPVGVALNDIKRPQQVTVDNH